MDDARDKMLEDLGFGPAAVVRGVIVGLASNGGAASQGAYTVTGVYPCRVRARARVAAAPLWPDEQQRLQEKAPSPRFRTTSLSERAVRMRFVQGPERGSPLIQPSVPIAAFEAARSTVLGELHGHPLEAVARRHGRPISWRRGIAFAVGAIATTVVSLHGNGLGKVMWEPHLFASTSPLLLDVASVTLALGVVLSVTSLPIALRSLATRIRTTFSWPLHLLAPASLLAEWQRRRTAAGARGGDPGPAGYGPLTPAVRLVHTLTTPPAQDVLPLLSLTTCRIDWVVELEGDVPPARDIAGQSLGLALAFSGLIALRKALVQQGFPAPAWLELASRNPLPYGLTGEMTDGGTVLHIGYLPHKLPTLLADDQTAVVPAANEADVRDVLTPWRRQFHLGVPAFTIVEGHGGERVGLVNRLSDVVRLVERRNRWRWLLQFALTWLRALPAISVRVGAVLLFVAVLLGVTVLVPPRPQVQLAEPVTAGIQLTGVHGVYIAPPGTYITIAVTIQPALPMTLHVSVLFDRGGDLLVLFDKSQTTPYRSLTLETRGTAQFDVHTPNQPQSITLLLEPSDRRLRGPETAPYTLRFDPPRAGRTPRGTGS